MLRMYVSLFRGLRRGIRSLNTKRRLLTRVCALVSCGYLGLLLCLLAQYVLLDIDSRLFAAGALREVGLGLNLFWVHWLPGMA